MRNIKLNKKNCLPKELSVKINDMSLYAIVRYIDDSPVNTYVDCALILDQFNLDFQRFRFYLNRLEEQNILKMNLIEDGEIVLEITFIDDVSGADSSINYFALPSSIFNNIYDLSLDNGFLDNEKYKMALFSYLQKNTMVMESKVINNMDEYKLFLNDVNPAEYICSATGGRLSYNQFNFLYKMFDFYNFDKPLINLAIDYTISTNVYSTFNEKFATKLLHNWFKQDINTIEKALEYISESKEKIQASKNDDVFVEPDWNTEDNVEAVEDDVFALLDRAYDE